MTKIFLSYRREDSREITARINDWFDMYLAGASPSVTSIACRRIATYPPISSRH